MCDSDTKEKFDLGFHYAGRMMLGSAVCAVLSVVSGGAPVISKL
jgi:hypothetical protein